MSFYADAPPDEIELVREEELKSGVRSSLPAPLGFFLEPERCERCGAVTFLLHEPITCSRNLGERVL